MEWMELHQVPLRIGYPFLVLACALPGQFVVHPLPDTAAAYTEAKGVLGSLLQFVGALAALLLPLLILLIESAVNRPAGISRRFVWNVVGLHSAVFSVLWVLAVEFVLFGFVNTFPQSVLPGLLTGATLAAALALLPVAVSTQRILAVALPNELQAKWRSRLRGRLARARHWDLVNRVAMAHAVRELQGSPITFSDPQDRAYSAEQRAQEAEIGRYLTDLNLAWLKKWSRALKKNDGAAVLCMPVSLGEDLYAITTLAKLSTGAIPEQRSRRIVRWAPKVLHLSKRGVPSPSRQVAADVAELYSLAREGLSAGDALRAASVLNDLYTLVIDQTQYVNDMLKSSALPVETAAVGGAILQAVRLNYRSVFELGVTRGDDQVAEELGNLWRAYWSLAAAAGDADALLELSRLSGWLRTISTHAPFRPTADRLRNVVATAPWDAIRWSLGVAAHSPKRNTLLVRFSRSLRATMAAEMDELRTCVENRDSDRFEASLAAFRGEFTDSSATQGGDELPYVPPPDGYAGELEGQSARANHLVYCR